MLTENEKLNNGSASHKLKTVSKNELNELQNKLSLAMENYKKNGGRRNIITFYDQSGQSRRVNTKKKITTIKKRKFIPYGMEDPDLAKIRKGKQSDKINNKFDDDGYDIDQYTQSSEANNEKINQEEEEEEEEYQQNKYRPRTLREKMDAVEELLAKMEGDLDEIEDYDFSDE